MHMLVINSVNKILQLFVEHLHFTPPLTAVTGWVKVLDTIKDPPELEEGHPSLVSGTFVLVPFN